jgi:hypothetical protein
MVLSLEEYKMVFYLACDSEHPLHPGCGTKARWVGVDQIQDVLHKFSIMQRARPHGTSDLANPVRSRRAVWTRHKDVT